MSVDRTALLPMKRPRRASRYNRTCVGHVRPVAGRTCSAGPPARTTLTTAAIASIMSRMSRYFCHDHPDVLSLETAIVDARPGAIVLARSPYHPGGGGQLPDRGRIAWENGEARVTGFEVVDGV